MYKLVHPTTTLYTSSEALAVAEQVTTDHTRVEPLTQAKRWRRAYSCLALVRRLAFAPDNCRSYTCDLSCALASQWVFLNLCTAFRSLKRSCVICARSPTRNLNIFSQLCYALLRSSPQHAVTLGVWLVSRPSTVLERTALWSVAGKPPKHRCVSPGVKTHSFRTVRNSTC